jgi:hypothetical protein
MTASSCSSVNLLDPPACFDLQFLWDQERAYLHVGRRLLLPHLRNGLRSALSEIVCQRFKKSLGENVTCTLGVSAKVSRAAAAPGYAAFRLSPELRNHISRTYGAAPATLIAKA